jgi:hypothetical protein
VGYRYLKLDYANQLSNGKSIETFLRLFPVAPVNFMNFPFPSRRFAGISNFILPLNIAL